MKRKSYDLAFKQRAIKLSENLGSTQQAAKELGIRSDLLSKWRRAAHQHPESPFPGKGNERLSEDQRKIRELEKELRESKIDLELLKKAVAFFSRADR
ncbi:MAG: transposase [Rikenellaceae bacterium]